jgi:hypothetical protein
MYADNELLFPHHVIASLRDLRGPAWQELVDRVVPLDECADEKLAFMLMMIRLDGCMSCETDSYRAMRGCMACAQQMLRRFKGEDTELLKRYDKALQDVRQFTLIQPQ